MSGGGTPLGRTISLALTAAAGAEVVIFGRRQEPLLKTATHPRGLKLSGPIYFEGADQHQDEDLERVRDRVAREGGGVRG